MDALNQGLGIASDPQLSGYVCSMLFFADTAISRLIVWKVPYTEIDWKAYMQQVAQFIAGERDYLKIYGDTGPLVYPALHVYIYRLLYAITGAGDNIELAQYIFLGLYLVTLALVMICYRQAKVPPFVFPLLILSKRLHSIFLLRLFNDCFAVFFLFLAIYCYQRRHWTIGSLAYSAGVAVKMSLLLALPAVGMILWQGMGRNRALKQAMVMAQLQLLFAYPFIAVNPQGYASRAFEFSRQFLFKWTVNWRFIGEEAFMSRNFHRGLLVAHGTLLGLLAWTNWLHAPVPRAIMQLLKPPPEYIQNNIARRVTPEHVLTTILSAVIVGCLCARSLHYQFYAYIAWSTPFLLWKSGLHPILIYAIWGAQEWAWNVYPSTELSSMIVVGCLKLTFLSLWEGFGEDSPAQVNAKRQRAMQKQAQQQAQDQPSQQEPI